MTYNITQLEMVNVVVVLKVWGQCWANRRLQIFCDKSVVDVLGFRRAKHSVLATCASNVWFLTAHYNTALVVSHIEGQENTVGDLLSASGQDPEFPLFQVCKPVGHVPLTDSVAKKQH